MRRWFLLAVMTLGAAGLASAVTLYDGSLGTLPDAQGWVWLTEPLVGSQATQTLAPGAALLDSTPAISDKAGWFGAVPPLAYRHPALPLLDRQGGYSLRFRLRLDSEDHGTRVDRAGFSVIALSSDLLGIELGFWTGEVWAQADNPAFTHAEGAAFDTTAAVVGYELCIGPGGYVLHADGLPVLSGPLRDYSSFGRPYDWPDFVFLGDDTGSARTRAELYRVELELAPSPPPTLGNSLRLWRAGGDIEGRVEPPAVPVASYRIHRDAVRSAIGGTLHLSSASPDFRDTASLAGPEDWYFAATFLDSCGRRRD